MKKLFFVWVAVSVLACSGGDAVPKGILPKQKMQAVLWDLLKTGEYFDGFVFNQDTTGMDRNAKVREWYDNVYRLHQVSRRDFEKSYAYYRSHPALMKEVLDSINKKQATPPPPPPVAPAPAAPAPTADTLKKPQTIQAVNKNRLLRMTDSVRRKKGLRRQRLIQER